MMRLPHPGRGSRQRPTWLWTMALLCVSLLFCASTAQACHAHDALLRSADGKAQISAPVDECPLCAAPHAALPAETQTTISPTPQVEALAVVASAVSRQIQWPFDLFSRPPPVLSRSDAMAGQG